MGSPEFAVPSLDALVEAGHEVVCVYTQPPRPAGRGKAEQKTAVHRRAEQLGIEVRCPKSLRNEEEQERFRALRADLAVVAAYGLILPKPILEAPKRGCINVHASLLPRWRGAAPIQRAILAGDEVTGITLMQMDEGLDTGPMLLTHSVDIDSKNAGELIDILAQLGGNSLRQYLADPEEYLPVPQPQEGATYAPKIDKAEARIDWSRSAEEIERQVRAFNPVPGAWFEVNGERVKLLEAIVVEEQADPRFRGGDDLARGNDGLVLDDLLLVKCGEGAIRPLKVQRGGRGPMSTDELLRGFPIPKGTTLQ